jgi:ABC-2 type transport system permease protein
MRRRILVHAALTIARRELDAYFVSPIAYLVTAAFLVISGFFFSVFLISAQQQPNNDITQVMQGLFNNINVILLFIAPLLTMRLLADEQRSGTIEVLLTAPVRDWEVVLGKFLAALALFLVMLLLTLLYPLFIWRMGGNPDWGPVFGGYLGLILLAGATLSIGTLASALTENQIVAAVIAFAILLVLWLIGAAGTVWTGAAEVFRALSILERSDNFARGVINLEDIVYYLSLIIGTLFITTRILETRRYS